MFHAASDTHFCPSHYLIQIKLNSVDNQRQDKTLKNEISQTEILREKEE